jgi:hypothetical protein
LFSKPHFKRVIFVALTATSSFVRTLSKIVEIAAKSNQEGLVGLLGNVDKNYRLNSFLGKTREQISLGRPLLGSE